MGFSARSYGLMAGAAVVAAALAGCKPPTPPRVVSALDCPGGQGDLTRQSAAADGKTCVYATDGGDQVTLQLVSLDGKDPGAVLGPVETQLKTELPAAGGDAPTPPGTPPVPDKDRVDIDLPGIHIHSSGDGQANIDAAGVHVDARGGEHGSGDHANVRVDGGGGGGGVTVNANDQSAQIRVNEKGSGVRAVYILASKTPGPHGYRAVGYEARGPAGGPIVVATILAKSEDRDDLRHDVRELLRRNVGG